MLTYDVAKSGWLWRSHQTMEISNANALYLTHFSLLCSESQWKQMIAHYWFKHAKWTCKYFFLFSACHQVNNLNILHSSLYSCVFFLCRVSPSPCPDDNVKLLSRFLHQLHMFIYRCKSFAFISTSCLENRTQALAERCSNVQFRTHISVKYTQRCNWLALYVKDRNAACTFTSHPPSCLSVPIVFLSGTQAVVCLFKCVCFFVGFVSCSLLQSVNGSWSTSLSVVINRSVFISHLPKHFLSLFLFISFLYPFSLCTQHGSRLFSGCVCVCFCVVHMKARYS